MNATAEITTKLASSTIWANMDAAHGVATAIGLTLAVGGVISIYTLVFQHTSKFPFQPVGLHPRTSNIRAILRLCPMILVLNSVTILFPELASVLGIFEVPV